VRSAFPRHADHGTKHYGHDRLRSFGRELVRRDREVGAALDVVDVGRHPVVPLLWLILVVSWRTSSTRGRGLWATSAGTSELLARLAQSQQKEALAAVEEADRLNRFTQR
jgi:hypothetical protein